MSKIGVWMDHAKAMFLEPGKSSDEIEIIESPHVTNLRVEGESNDTTLFNSREEKGYHTSGNEFRKNQTDQNEHKQYYQSLEEKLTVYEDILLIGPSKAKEEFHNLLKNNKQFDNKNITVLAADKMTDNQLAAYFREAFA